MSIQTIIRKTFVTISLSLMSLFVVPNAYAATLNLTPATGSFGNAFTVDLIVDGGAQSFNAAQATVTLSTNLQLTDLVYGDCNFSFLTIPSTTSPSFTGVLLGTSSKKCTAYTMTLSPTSTGQGSLTLTNASIREYTTAKELFTSAQSASYNLTRAQSGVTPVPTVAVSGGAISAYSLNVTLVSDTNTPIKESQVVLTPQEGTGNPLQVTTDANGVAQLENVPPGVYKMAVKDKGQVLSERVITVAGSNPDIAFGVKQEKKQGSTPLVLIGGMLLGLVLIIIALWFFLSRRKNQV